MAKLVLSLILLLIISTFVVEGAIVPKFIELQCRRTRYPDLCERSLANHVNPTSQDPQEIAQVALKVSIVKAVYTKIYLRKVSNELKQNKAKEYQAVEDCLDQMSDSVSQLTNSFKELQRMESADAEGDFVWCQSNVQTWLSTVLTDTYICMDGFSGYSMGGKVMATIKARVLNVAQVTSNTLALFNGFAAWHKANSNGGSYGKNEP
ncbi:PREDICTED: 21 kDa protein-like [Nicotiana attenuata]|uniref:21 kDa protein n=1 Tax=Nicotiana attenuata TaxID=49451 RepID=A0A1J6IRD0_NICAT|nr:PREDICTED: 21 kDa protein-like [Nicotiana attenuata]OIT07266.1 21 kda protein [Nicotiana attenuata]